MSTLYLLFESSSGYGLFERVKGEEINLTNAQTDITDVKRFSEMVKLKSFLPFTSAENALENINAISEGEATKFLLHWLELTLPKPGKKSNYELGVIDPKLGGSIKDALSMNCVNNTQVNELIRGCRLHFVRFINGLKASDLHQSQLGLSHSYSRSKVKFNVHRVDNMIIQSCALLDQLDKDLNTFAMRCREWYSWHFPELVRVVPDNIQFARCAKAIGNKSTLNADSLQTLAEITEDDAAAQAIIDAARMSMGTDISAVDLENILTFADRVVSLGAFRKQLHAYLLAKMNLCAPNLSALCGEQVGARLISHAGSLTSLAKFPASTVQILGAEKALFRALKTKGNTPKYGLIFHSTFIARAAAKNKGRISRYLANKCSLASRIDCFSEQAQNGTGQVSSIYGVKLREQVEERLEFYRTGTAPKKNLTVMEEAIRLDKESQAESGDADMTTEESEEEAKKRRKAEKKEKKRKSLALTETSEQMEVDGDEEKPKKSKKSKKSKE